MPDHRVTLTQCFHSLGQRAVIMEPFGKTDGVVRHVQRSVFSTRKINKPFLIAVVRVVDPEHVLFGNPAERENRVQRRTPESFSHEEHDSRFP